jgi:hypothetical protein
MVVIPFVDFLLYIAKFDVSKYIVFSDSGVLALSHKMQLGFCLFFDFLSLQPLCPPCQTLCLTAHDAQANGFCFDREGS